MNSLTRLRELASRHETQLRFVLVGGVNTIAGLSFFSGLYLLLNKLHVHYVVVFVLSYICASTFSFFTNKWFVFRTVGNYISEYLKFISFQLMHFSLNLIGLPLLVEFCKFTPIFAQFTFAGLVIITSYFWYSRITFIRKGIAS